MKKTIFLTSLVLGLVFNLFARTTAQKQEKKEARTEKHQIAKLERFEAESESGAVEKRNADGIKYRLLPGSGLLIAEAYISPADEISHTITLERNPNGNLDNIFSETKSFVKQLQSVRNADIFPRFLPLVFNTDSKNTKAETAAKISQN